MIDRRRVLATAIIASVLGTACSETTAPNPLDGGASLSARSEHFHLEKNCGDYHGLPGDICTITSSSVKGIPAESRIIYASGATGASLSTDVTVDPPGPGNNRASGHCAITLVPVSVGTRVGGCTLTGGTGKFRKISAEVDVIYLGGFDYAWDGTYSFSSED